MIGVGSLLMALSNAAPAPYDPALLTLSLWVRSSFPGAPWTGLASAGASGGRDLDEATNPPTIAGFLGSYNPAAFDGINQKLSNATTCSTVCPDAAGSIGCLFYADAALADPGDAAYYQNPSFLVNATDGYLGFGFNANGAVLGSYDSTSATFDSVAAAASTGAWHFAQARWDNSAGGGAGLMEVRVDGGTWQPLVKLVESSLSAGGLLVGTSFSSAFFLEGQIAELFAAPSRLADAVWDDWRAYFLTRYGVTV
jgi:hypothetical protein